MANIQIFDNANFNAHIRTIEFDNEVWFVGKDVATALGYSNASKAIIMHVDPEDKRKEMLEARSQNGNVVTETTLINESGIYSLVATSNLPTAHAFRRWVTSEVLPSIRKTGAYMTPAAQGAALMQQFSDPRVLAGLLNAFADEKDAHAATKEKLAEAEAENEHSRSVLGIKAGWGFSCTEICNTHLGRKISRDALIQMMRDDGLFQKTKELHPAQQLLDCNIMMMVPEQWGNKQGTSLTAKFVTTSIQAMMPYFEACVACVVPMANVNRAQHELDKAARKYARVTSPKAKAKALEEGKVAKEALEEAQEELTLCIQARQDKAVNLLTGNFTPATTAA